MNFNKSLLCEDVALQIMTPNDFERLFEVAKDPEIWDQHDAKERCEQEGFRKFFDDAINNLQNCYLIFYKDELVGSTRYYEYDSVVSSVKVGYTFYAKKCWGTGLNKKIKTLMLNYAFKHVDNALFDVWLNNFRSQKAVEKLGAKLYKNDSLRERLIFRLNKKDWEDSK